MTKQKESKDKNQAADSDCESEAAFTQEDFDDALRRASQRISEPD